MQLRSTAYVILGLLRERPRSGYEIKAAVDRSTRFFWAASYGQIYPELRRLRELGLVRASDRTQGRRPRKVYSLTAQGRRELERWLAQPAALLELRDEGLLKLFFADALAPAASEQMLAAKRDRHAALVERLREIERDAASKSERPEYLVLRFGIEMNEWIAAWCERERRRLAQRPKRRAA